MDQYQYRLIKPHEDYKEAVIEKAGIKSEFTIAEVEAMQDHNKKALAETEGNLELRRAEIVNIDHFHPMIKDMTGEQLAAAWIYKEALDFIRKAEPAIETIKAAIAENDALIDQVISDLGLVVAVDPIKSEEKPNE